MNYLIDNCIVFNPELKMISSKKNPDISIPLTTTATRLLEELVRKPNETLTRSYLLKAVWEDNGYASSDASLNNNISLLRKNFFTVSETEIALKTIPKTGFQLHALVEPFENQANDDNHNEAIQLDEQRNTLDKNPSSILFRSLLLVSVIILISIAVLLVIHQKNVILFKEVNSVFVGKVGMCDAFNLSSTKVDLGIILQTYPVLKEKCENQSGIIYYDFSDLTKDRTKNLFVALCYQSENYGYQKCENIKSYSLQ
ncbi:winged helix-turn-helix domain-containing protein [Enterobacter soli]|uniref:winged helix-turn-helix domain-containing protein n=1 Tax=Enterobacter soli TaxID=885040 RepID=UPI003ED9BFF4